MIANNCQQQLMISAAIFHKKTTTITFYKGIYEITWQLTIDDGRNGI